MPQNVERPKTDESEIGLEVVDGLENTLAWIKSQFDNFRTDVYTESAPRVASASTNN